MPMEIGISEVEERSANSENSTRHCEEDSGVGKIRIGVELEGGCSRAAHFQTFHELGERCKLSMN